MILFLGRTLATRIFPDFISALLSEDRLLPLPAMQLASMGDRLCST